MFDYGDLWFIELLRFFMRFFLVCFEDYLYFGVVFGGRFGLGGE